jgi:hypothetical protein
MKELELLWQESSNFINFFCSDNLVNQKALHPAIDYLIEGVNTKFPGCPYVIHVLPSLLHLSSLPSLDPRLPDDRIYLSQCAHQSDLSPC